jgi:hypothetical protein
MRHVSLTVKGTPVGPRRERHRFLRQGVTTTYEVLRFGLHCPTTKSKPVTVGLASEQLHVIKAWLPHYSVHSASARPAVVKAS